MNLRRFNTEEKAELDVNENLIPNGIVDISTEQNTVTVLLSGKIDANNFQEIQKKAFELLDKHNTKHLIFNMKEVTYVSSAGLRMFSAVNQKATENIISYKLIQMKESISKLFQLTGYASAFTIELLEE